MICCWIIAALMFLMAVPGAMAQSQDLGHKILGGIGLDAGTQPDAGLYVGDRFLYYRADELFDRNGERIPLKGLDIKAASNVAGCACGTSAMISTPPYPMVAIASIASASVCFLNALVEKARRCIEQIVLQCIHAACERNEQRI